MSAERNVPAVISREGGNDGRDGAGLASTAIDPAGQAPKPPSMVWNEPVIIPACGPAT